MKSDGNEEEEMDNRECENICSSDENITTSVPKAFLKKPLFFWVKSFAEKEIHEDDSFSNFLGSNAISYALEYIGISSENEQSSLHLSAIFDEDSQQQSKIKYPTHYESETKNRIQSLNRIFVELKSFFEDNFSQLIAIRPPNTVHIASACQHCSLKEFEKLLFLLLGAAIQGTRKQETIKKIKRFPSQIQENLIECIKMIADNPELINVKSWMEYSSLDPCEQQKVYENLFTLLRRLISERNECIQTQLISDYFAGYMNCDQKRIYEGKNYGPESDFVKYSDDTRLSGALRLLKDELHIKSELLQECRDELEKTKSRVQELENELSETQQTLRSYKKTRDELDALREGQERASRLEGEYHWMKTKLEETKHICETVEALEAENRNLQLKNDILIDKISFLTIERQSNDENSFEFLAQYDHHQNIEEDGELDLNKNSRLLNETSNLFDLEDRFLSDQKVSSKRSTESQTEEIFVVQGKSTATFPAEIHVREDEDENSNNNVCAKYEDSVQLEEIKSNSGAGSELDDSAIITKIVAEQPGNTNDKRTKRRRRRSSTLNVKRTRKTVFVPVRVGQRIVPVSPTENGILTKNSAGPDTSTINPTVKLVKVYNVDRNKRKSGRPIRNKIIKRRPFNDKQTIPNLDVENDADEELSLSPNGLPNESDIEDQGIHECEENDSDIFFVCASTTSAGAPGRSNFGKVTSLALSSPGNSSNGNGIGQTINNLNANHSIISTLQVPFLKISNGVNVAIEPPDSDGGSKQNDEDAHLNDCNIQLSLRKSIKPSTAFINKISTLSTNLNVNLSNISDPHHENIESSSEDDDSVWYEYGCV